MKPLSVSSSPHLRLSDSTPRIMWSVVLALTPALLAAGYFFGWRAWWVTALSLLGATVGEALVQKIRRQPITLADGSAVVTGLLVAFCLPPTVRWFVPVVAGLSGIVIAKQLFGGLGYNIWNPALIGRAIVHNSFPVDMNPTFYPVVRTPEGGSWLANFFHHFTVDVGTVIEPAMRPDAVTGASPLKALKAGLVYIPDRLADASATLQTKFTAAFNFTSPAASAANSPVPLNQGVDPSLLQPVTMWDAFVGNIGGNLGEVSALLLLAGAVFLIFKGYIRWYVPALYMGTVAVLVTVLPLPLGPADQKWVWFAGLQAGGDVALRYVGYHLLCGGLVLGACYMATDMVTSPITRRGMMIFAVGCGLLTTLIRLYGQFPEGVCYSILLMNTAVPLIDRWTRPRIFGTGLKVAGDGPPGSGPGPKVPGPGGAR